MIKRGIGICHYNRPEGLEKVIEGVLNTMPEGTKVVVADDGSKEVSELDDRIILVQGQNLGVAANKNRALTAMQDCHYIALLEDDLIPTEEGWFELYEAAARATGNHHFCRVQDKEVPESHPSFTEYCSTIGVTPVFAPSPRGDFTFITGTVLRTVGGLNPRFRGAGYAHGEWSKRIAKANLIAHPLRWWDISEARSKFVQFGDTSGGRWEVSDEVIKAQVLKNREIARELDDSPEMYCPLVIE